MNLFELTRTVTKKLNGDEYDFIDYLIIIRKWFDKNTTLNRLNGNVALYDKRFKSLRTALRKKEKHSEYRRPFKVRKKESQFSQRYYEIKEKHLF